jgi:hypothetical protein
MNYSDELKIVWITPMRTGARSSGSVMSKLNFENDNGKVQDAGVVHGIGIPQGKEHYKLIVNIRNPYSRSVSIFHINKTRSEKNHEKSFYDWVTKKKHDHHDEFLNIYIANQIKKLPKEPDFYVRMENFQDDIRSLWFVKENIDLLEQTISYNIDKNRYSSEFDSCGFSMKKSWKDYYDEEMSEIVYEKLKNEFLFFNYDKNSWK